MKKSLFRFSGIIAWIDREKKPQFRQLKRICTQGILFEWAISKKRARFYFISEIYNLLKEFCHFEEQPRDIRNIWIDEKQIKKVFPKLKKERRFSLFKNRGS